MSELNKAATVTLLGKTFQIKCPESQVVELQQSAAYLNAKMSELQQNSHVIGLERIAVIAALNITQELLANQHKDQQNQADLSQRCDKLLNKITKTLTKSS